MTARAPSGLRGAATLGSIMEDKTAEAAKSVVDEDQVCDSGPVQYQLDCRAGNLRLIDRRADAGDKAARSVRWHGRLSTPP